MASLREKKIGFADMYGTTAAVEVDDSNDIRVELGVGGCSAVGYPTPEAARQLAAALLDAVDAAEAGEGR